MAKRQVGLDIGTHGVHVSEVSVGRGGVRRLVNFGMAELPVGAVNDGEVVDVGTVANTITALMDATGIKTKDVVLGVANQRVFVRQVELPWMDPEQLRESLAFQVQEYLPIPVEEAELDFFVLDEPYVGEERLSRLLLVGAQREMIQAHVDAVELAGYRPTVIDLNALALLRTLRTEAPLAGERSEVLIDIGAGVTNIVVHEAGVPRFARTLILGGDDLTNGIAEELDVPADEAARLKHATGLVGGDDPVARAIAQRAQPFLEEIRGSLDYYRAQGGAQMSQVLLCGGGSLLLGLAERMEQELRLPVAVGEPLSHLEVADTSLDDEQLRAVEPLLATSIGLAIGGLS